MKKITEKRRGSQEEESRAKRGVHLKKFGTKNIDGSKWSGEV